MTSPPHVSNVSSWESLILTERSASDIWTDIFKRLGEIAVASKSSAALHRETIIPDRLLAESAWDLWQSFATAAPKVINMLQDFWSSSNASDGTAVLILDGLSLRELPLIIAAASKRSITPASISVRGSEVPSETQSFAAALGLSSRSKLFNNRPPHSFIFAGEDVHTDVLEAPFADCVSLIPAKTRLFLWHKWPDEPLIHLHADHTNGSVVVAAEIKRSLASNDFWGLVNYLRQGRRLLITGDHGYATASDFSSEIREKESIRLFAGTFGAQRAVREDPSQPWPCRHLPPPVLRVTDVDGTWLVVLGQRKWKVRGGFPTLCHRGLSLLETAVPVIELPAI